MKGGECWLQNVHIAAHESTGRYFQHDETRSRRLLLHKSEIRKLDAEVSRKGLTIVPLKAYFTDGGRLKVQASGARDLCTRPRHSLAAPPLQRAAANPRTVASSWSTWRLCVGVSQIGLARGKQLHDKRETIRRREIDRDTSRAIKSMPLG